MSISVFPTRPIVQRGFTLIELMMTIAILAILAMIAYPSYTAYIQSARLENARATMVDAIQFVERQYAQNHTFADITSSTISSAGITNDKYDLLFSEKGSRTVTSKTKKQSSSYTLVAKPKAGVYSSNKLNDEYLIIFYNSTTGTFARCTAGGLLNAENNAASDDGCKPFS